MAVYKPGDIIGTAQDFLNQADDPGTPIAGTVSLFAKADKFKYITSDGSIKDIGAGAGINNYIASYDGSAILGWKMYADAPGSIPVDGTGSFETCTLTTGTNVVSHSIPYIALNAPVVFCTLGTATGIATYTTYYARDMGAGTFKLATTIGGSVVPITASGSGTFVVFASFITSSVNPLRAPSSFLFSQAGYSNARGRGVS